LKSFIFCESVDADDVRQSVKRPSNIIYALWNICKKPFWVATVRQRICASLAV